MSRRRKDWNTEVTKTVNLLEIRNIVSDVTISTKVAMKKVIEQVNSINNTEWQRELFNDRGKDNGNKLRTYRKYKSNCSNVSNDCKYSYVLPIYTTSSGNQQALPVGRQQQAFPVRTFKVFGGVQIGLGVLLGILSLIRMISDKIAQNKYHDCLANTYSVHYSGNYYNDCSRYYNVHAPSSFDITCLICSGWKTGFMVCSIIGASIFIPAMLSLGVVGSFMTRNQDSKAVILSVFMAVLFFAEVVVAIIASSFCCCCSTWRTSIQEGVVTMQGTQPELFLNLPQTQIPMANDQQVMIATGQTANPIVQYSRGQQYQEMTTTQPAEQQVQAVGGIQPEPKSGQDFDTNPPAYKE
ncbi:unnamed protein product [Mytilus coruscus]|uniref:Uncharacterized protein n=1 Tax=Mytilus coruscus TaxID=42192 RepID=A0A6J8DGW4_MYTCO|nr:unnamed protein product [Mytilus coruscus]